jgi:hypothetical protein
MLHSVIALISLREFERNDILSLALTCKGFYQIFDNKYLKYNRNVKSLSKYSMHGNSRTLEMIYKDCVNIISITKKPNSTMCEITNFAVKDLSMGFIDVNGETKEYYERSNNDLVLELSKNGEKYAFTYFFSPSILVCFEEYDKNRQSITIKIGELEFMLKFFNSITGFDKFGRILRFSNSSGCVIYKKN